jgi:hypothetical protein
MDLHRGFGAVPTVAILFVAFHASPPFILVVFVPRQQVSFYRPHSLAACAFSFVACF